MRMLSVMFAFAPLAVHAAAIPADSARGGELFTSLSCVQCHAINGKGGSVAPDLGQRIGRDFTPASLAATMWNHAPGMWAAMRERNVAPRGLTVQGAMDLFAYFYAARFFDKPGDAARGKRVFESRHCSECHGLTETKFPAAKPVAQWESIGDPVNLTDAMWNHAGSMRDEFARRKLRWPELTSQDLTDVLVYLRNLPEERNLPVRIVISSGSDGQSLFESKGCASCHHDLRLGRMTLTDIAAAMWNHAPKMALNPPYLSPEEMRQVVSYLWADQFFKDEGNSAAGRRVFASKHCATCHYDGSKVAPKLTGKSLTAAGMVSALWRHGPGMLDRIRADGLRWPRFSGRDMANLIAYLNSREGAK
jgi:mono/diheme cytochrome c family protein